MDTFEIINEYWALIVGISSLIWAFAQIQISNKTLKKKDEEQDKDLHEMKLTHQKDINEMRLKQDSYNLEFKKIEVSIASVQADVAFIKNILSSREK